jgi:hypothetical protein
MDRDGRKEGNQDEVATEAEKSQMGVVLSLATFL